MDPPRSIPLHLATFSLISASNSPLCTHSYTGQGDALRYMHLAYAAVDVFEDREMNPIQENGVNYLGLLFSMDDLVLYGYRAPTGLKIIIGLALIDGSIKDTDVLTICKAVHQLYITTTSNPFLALSSSSSSSSSSENGFKNIGLPTFEGSKHMQEGAIKLGRLLDGGRGGRSI